MSQHSHDKVFEANIFFNIFEFSQLVNFLTPGFKLLQLTYEEAIF